MAKRRRGKVSRGGVKKAGKVRKSAKKVSRRAQKSTKGRKGRGKTKRAVARRAKPSARSSAKRSAKRAVRKAPRKRVQRIAAPARPERLNRERRVLVEEAVQSPPSSLDMDRHGSAAQSGRKGLAANIRRHNAVTPALTGGDVDADWENAYFSGDEAPGGDNLTPDQEDVDDMGKTLGVEYQDNEELQGSDKVVKRDAHRWELDPASADDYKDRT